MTTTPPPLPIRANAIPLSAGTTDFSVSCIFGMCLEPERGQVSPDFLEYQDAEGPTVEQDGEGVETGAAGEGPDTSQVPVRIPSTSDLSAIRCTPDQRLAPDDDPDYYHNTTPGQFHFVPEGHARQVLADLIATPVREEEQQVDVYHLTTDEEEEDHDSDKENNQDAAAIPTRGQDAKGVGAHRHRGRQGGRGR